jgi:preprotein translocase subunit SecE
MAKKSAQRPGAIHDRAARTAAALATPGAVAQADRRGGAADFIRNLPRFSKEVRAEARKITWTSRRETWVTSVMVAIMVFLAALFFYVVDLVLRVGVSQLLKLSMPGS